MALVRCTCVVEISLVRGVAEMRVDLADPECTYPPHRQLHEPRPIATG
jgi:hypothetical protein